MKKEILKLCLLLNMLPAIINGRKNGGILIIDEFSSANHNFRDELLLKYIFSNSKNVQVFYRQHSTNLLKTSLLRPDQIYIVEMDSEGSHVNYSVTKLPSIDSVMAFTITPQGRPSPILLPLQVTQIHL